MKNIFQNHYSLNFSNIPKKLFDFLIAFCTILPMKTGSVAYKPGARIEKCKEGFRAQFRY